MKNLIIPICLFLSACYAKGSAIDKLMNKEAEVVCEGDFEWCYWESSQACRGKGFEPQEFYIVTARFHDSKTLILNLICYD